MGVSVRRYLAVGTAAVAASAIVGAPVRPPGPVPSAQPVSVARIDLAAAARPLVVTPPDRAELTAARDALTRLAPDLAQPLAAAPQNAASNAIVAAYEFVMYWASYGVDLANYVLQFIPFGYLISAQVDIVYDTLVVPIGNSIVYDLVVPVVNDPLNIWSYVNGLAAVGSTTVVSLINAGIAEFNYFFGWLIPPLPPLPFAAAAAVEETPEALTTAAVASEDDAAGDDTAPATEPPATEPTATEPTATGPTEPAVTEADTLAADIPSAATEVTATAPETVPETETETATVEPTKPTVDSKGGVSAQGEVRTGGQTAPSTSTESAADEKATGDTTAPTATPTTTGPTTSTPTSTESPGAGTSGTDDSDDSGSSATSAAA